MLEVRLLLAISNRKLLLERVEVDEKGALLSDEILEVDELPPNTTCRN